MAVKIRNNSNNGWQNIATLKIRNNDNNGWHTVNTGRIWTGTAWSRFYQRITTTAPIVSATTVTKNAITWTVTQASTLQFAEFPSQFQYYIVYPSGLRSPSTGYSYTDARVSTISLTGLSQNQTVSLYYRLMYEDDTPGDNSDNIYYPEDETYELKQTTTVATTVEDPTVTGAGSSAPNSVSFFVNYNEADSFNWYLYRTSDSQFIDDGVRTFAGNQGTFSITVPYHDTNYRLYVRANYETDFSPNEYTYATGYQTSDAVVAVAPTVTGTALNSFQISWNISFNGANYVTWTLIRVSTGSIIDSGTVFSAGALVTSSLVSNAQYRLKADGVFTDYGAFEVATTNAFATTEVFVPESPTITFNLRGYNFIDWTVSSTFPTVEWRVGTTSLGSQVDSGFSAGGLNVFVAVPISATATTYYISARAYSSSGEVSAWATATANKVSLTNPSVTFGSVGTLPNGQTILTWNINNGSGSNISYELRRSGTLLASGTTTSSSYSYTNASMPSGTYTLFYRSRISGILANPDFWAPTSAEGSYVNWPGSSRTI
jgi:hypothetical protein